MKPQEKSKARWLIPGLLAFSLGGCGLADYQAKMDEQRKRVQEFDTANRLLEDPIELPRIVDQTQQEKNAWGFDVFLRLPKGCSTLPREKAPYLYPFPFFRYTGGNEGFTNIFIGAAWIAEPKAKDEWGRYSRTTFRGLVKQALEEFYLKAYKSPFIFSDKIEAKTREVKIVAAYPNPAAALTYTMLAYSDESNKLAKQHSVFEVFYREEGIRQVCIVFQRPARPINPDALNKSIDACLGTIDLMDAGSKRVDYKKAKGK